jgi:hypothetical protein
MATFEVTNLNDSGVGSLRDAIERANEAEGLDTITFASGLGGRITLLSALPEISSPVVMNALASGASNPRIQIDFSGKPGITFAGGSGGSSLIGFSLVGASGAGVTLASSNNTIQNNYIGLDLDGSTVIANQGNGITIAATSTGNLIGSTTPGSSTAWSDVSQEPGYEIDAIQGIRYGTTSDYILCGSGSVSGGSGQGIGVVYLGEADSSGAPWYTVNAATAFGGTGSSITSCYGPEQIDAGTIRVVGSYNSSGDIPPTDTSGFIYTGSVEGANGTTSGFVRYQHPGSTWTFFHSTQDGLVVGNWDNTVTIPDTSQPIVGVGKAFIYDVESANSIADVRFPGSKSTSAYGIAKVNDKLFAITGSYSLEGEGDNTGHGYLVYYDRDTNAFSDWVSWDIDDETKGNFISHADGISYNSADNTFTLATVALSASDGNSPIGGYLMSVDRNADGSFGAKRWTEVNYQNQSGGVTAPTSVAGNVMTGLYIGDLSTATWSSDTNFFVEPSNVISGNALNGIAIIGSSKVDGTNNTIAQNRIGTSADGLTAVANGENGLLIEESSRNLIGGTITGDNDPTKGVTTPPPLGNLISGNSGHGVLISNGSTDNILSGNFIGTTASGNQRLGNGGDGVSIINSGNNKLLGTQLEASPFVFYNVVSGNSGNGLRIKDSDSTVIHANFFGLAANNLAPLGNGGNGALIEGSSANTQYGGVIPLGNVNSGNVFNGIEVRDAATGFITFNTFAGTTAFGGIAPNQRNGMLFTSAGGNNTIRTNVVGGNIGNGIHITGGATGITVDPNIIGLNSYGTESTYSYSFGEVVSFANGLDGILVDGDAQEISIAGTYQSVIPQNTISNNKGYGIRVAGNAKNVQIANTAIGTGSNTLSFDKKFGNQLGGIFIGGNSNAVTLGDASGATGLLIANNQGDGLVIDGKLNNQIANAVFRDNTGYGVSFLGVNKIQADQQVNGGLSFVDNEFGALQVAPGWANLSLSRSVGSDRFTVAANTGISLMRLDTSSQVVNFGVESQSTGTMLPLTQLNAASAQSLELQKIFANTWTTTEGVALGGRQATSIAADTWIPIATDQSGNRLELQGLTLAGNSATATFAGGIQAVYSVGGSGVLATAASDGPVASVTATVRRLGRYDNSLAIYEADALTGAVNGLLPGSSGYLQAALQNAKQSGRVFAASQLPGYGQSGSINFSVSTQKNYGFLVLVDGNESNLYSSYSAANPGGSVQFTSFTTPGGELTIGLEDLLTSSQSDQDFNDLILSISPAASQAERTLVSPFYYTGLGASTSEYGLQGIKGADTAGSYYMVGTSGVNGVVYDGPIDTVSTSNGSGSGLWMVMNVPFSSTATSIYGVDNLAGANVTLVGSYHPPSSTKTQNSFYYVGPVTATSSAANWKSFQATGSQGAATYTILHSVDEGLAVGNYDYASMDVGEGTWRGNAFIYDPLGNGGAGQQLDITYPVGAGTHTAYGIWYNGIVNGRKSYTIAGGEAFQFGSSDPANASLIDFDYDSVTGLTSGRFSNFRTFGYVQDDPTAPTTDAILATHFEGIWYDGVSTYRLPATLVNKSGQILGGYAEIERLSSGQFSSVVNWDVFNQGVLGTSNVVTNDSLFRGASVGVVQSSTGLDYALV